MHKRQVLLIPRENVSSVYNGSYRAFSCSRSQSTESVIVTGKHKPLIQHGVFAVFFLFGVVRAEGQYAVPLADGFENKHHIGEVL